MMLQEKNTDMGKLFYIMGKSASGKDTIYQKLLENPELHFRRLIIYTTRPIRDGEKDGQEYYFVNEDEFQCLKASGKIIEDRGYESVYGLWRYFTVDNMNLEKYNYHLQKPDCLHDDLYTLSCQPLKNKKLPVLIFPNLHNQDI